MRAVAAAVLLVGGVALAVPFVQAEQAAAPEAVPGAVAPDDFYDPTGRRDPFRPPQARAIAAAGGDRSPLQRYEIGQLKLVAVIYDTESPRAVVEDEAGLGYIVRVGTEIGVNGGTVRAIDRGRILVEEQSVDFFGEARASEVILEMASGERGSR
jgi:type IV pilus assembly protein PilP